MTRPRPARTTQLTTKIPNFFGKEEDDLEFLAQAQSGNVYSESSETESKEQSSKPEQLEEGLSEIEQEAQREQEEVAMKFDWSLEENVKQEKQKGLERTAQVVVGKKPSEVEMFAQEELPSTKIQPLSAKVEIVVEFPKTKIPEPANKSLPPSENSGNMFARVLQDIAEKQYQAARLKQEEEYQRSLAISLEQQKKEIERQQAERKEQDEDEAKKNKSAERPSPSPESPQLGKNINGVQEKSQDDGNTFDEIARSMKKHIEQNYDQETQKEDTRKFQNLVQERSDGGFGCRR